MYAVRRISLGAALVVAVAVAAAAPASAQWQRFTDQRGDVASSIDVHSVRVVNGTPDAHGVKIVVQQETLLGGDHGTVWIDTDRANPGPEFKVDWIANTDAFGLLKVDTFKDPGTIVDCPGLRIRSDEYAVGDHSTIRIPRSGLDRPSDVRVSVKMSRTDAGHTWVDWAPGARGFYAWVDRG